MSTREIFPVINPNLDILSRFDKLGQKITKPDLTDFLRACPPEDLALAADLIYEHYTVRPVNVNGCHCRFEYAEGCSNCSSWHSLFHGDIEVAEAPPITFAIEKFLQNDAITMIGGLPGHGKTWVMLSMAKALLDGTPLFGYDGFKVAAPAEKVVYLCPESSLTPFASRLKLFGLDKHVRGPGDWQRDKDGKLRMVKEPGRLFCRTISVDSERLTLNDLRLCHAVDGAHVFLDTATRFMTGDENSAGEQREFSHTLFQLLAVGAKTITAAHHAPKGSENIPANKMSLETILRGTGELGAMVATCWALKQTDTARNRIYVRNVKARDFEAVDDFALQGRPQIDQTGDFKMAAIPGLAVAPDVERLNKKAGQIAEARVMQEAGHTKDEIAAHFGVALRTVQRWLPDDIDATTRDKSVS